MNGSVRDRKSGHYGAIEACYSRPLPSSFPRAPGSIPSPSELEERGSSLGLSQGALSLWYCLPSIALSDVGHSPPPPWQRLGRGPIKWGSGVIRRGGTHMHAGAHTHTHARTHARGRTHTRARALFTLLGFVGECVFVCIYVCVWVCVCVRLSLCTCVSESAIARCIDATG